MVIGVDAGSLAEKDERLKVGVYRVVFELLKHLSTFDKKNQYYLYSFSPIPKDVMGQFATNMVNIPLAPSFGYMAVRLPLKLLFRPVDLFLGLSQAIPVGQKRSVGFVYDVGFLKHPEMYGDKVKKLASQTEFLVKHATRIITISESSKKDIISAYKRKEQDVAVYYPGVNENFSINSIPKKYSSPYFLSVGLLKPNKNIPIAIRAFGMFLDKIKKPFDLIIIGGDRGLDPSITQTINELHLEQRVKLLGYQPDRELASWYRGAKGLLALSETEGFCLPAVEAISSGCPIIFANSGALPEIVGHSGIAVSVQKPETIVHAMMTMTREKVQVTDNKTKYSWSLFAKNVYDLCNRINTQ